MVSCTCMAYPAGILQIFTAQPWQRLHTSDTPKQGDVCLNSRYLQCPGSLQRSEFHLLLCCSSAHSLCQKCARIPDMKQHFSFYSPFEYCSILSTRTGYLVIRWVTSKMHSGIPRRRANRLLFLSCTDRNIYLSSKCILHHHLTNKKYDLNALG